MLILVSSCVLIFFRNIFSSVCVLVHLCFLFQSDQVSKDTKQNMLKNIQVQLVQKQEYSSCFVGDDINIQSILRRVRFIKKEKYPSFDENIPLRIRQSEGEVAFLTCIVKNIVNESVSWIRNRDLHILSVNDYIFIQDRRFEMLTDTSTNWTLKINDIRPEDTGVYECQISTQPVKSLSVYLIVLELLTERNSVKQFLDYAMEDYEKEKIDLANDGAGELLKFSGEDMRSSTRILEGSEIRTVEGGVMNITCEVLIRQSQLQTSSKEKEMLDTKILLVWFHNEKMISEDICHDGTFILTMNSSNLIRSRLVILHAYKNDSGDYRCHPFQFNDATVSVYVLNSLGFAIPSSHVLIISYNSGEENSYQHRPLIILYILNIDNFR